MRRQTPIAAAKRAAPALRRLMLGLLGSAALVAFCLPASAQDGGGRFLDAKYCTDTLNLNPGSDYDGGSCQLWRLVPDAAGWSRLQLKRNGKYLDARKCTDQLNMNPGSNFDNGSCQLWKFVPDADGWSRVMLKRNGKFLNADHCGDDVQLSDASTAEDGASQLWRLVPVEGSDGWSRLQVKCVGAAAPNVVEGGDEYTFNGDTYGWYDDGWDGPGWYIIGFEFRRGFGFGGREGWHGWKHHGSHAHTPQAGGHAGGGGPGGGHGHHVGSGLPGPGHRYGAVHAGSARRAVVFRGGGGGSHGGGGGGGHGGGGGGGGGHGGGGGGKHR